MAVAWLFAIHPGQLPTTGQNPSAASPFALLHRAVAALDTTTHEGRASNLLIGNRTIPSLRGKVNSHNMNPQLNNESFGAVQY
jgi:hypothetical protein